MYIYIYVFIAFMPIYMNMMCISYGVLSVACIRLVCAGLSQVSSAPWMQGSVRCRSG